MKVEASHIGDCTGFEQARSYQRKILLLDMDVLLKFDSTQKIKSATYRASASYLAPAAKQKLEKQENQNQVPRTAIQSLFFDFADALNAYHQASYSPAEHAAHPAPCIQLLSAESAGSLHVTKTNSGATLQTLDTSLPSDEEAAPNKPDMQHASSSPDTPSACISAADTLILGISDTALCQPAALVAALRHVLSGHSQGAYIYAIIATSSTADEDSSAFNPSQINKALQELVAVCEQADMHWLGGVQVYSAEQLLALNHEPRMGCFRRPISEAMDSLIAAVRSKVATWESAGHLFANTQNPPDEHGIIHAKLGGPRWLMRLKTRR
ncbi:hypothetical protein KPC83_05670 [Collinsella sp. zg1085]|uniref:hypothetical protein n=1 Tax=Collinsella sp. zg1085 TaxID=2844380 RepID=UPI001C0C2AF3|nr:hypothetical protein [Collinsella sp. zg1085]QWT17331.1 hypothetical protein KPC83_05670 [Collinsella sp. zg1085]